MISPVYWHPRIYDAVLAVLNGRARRERFLAVAREIADGDEVLDVCCGTGGLARVGLRGRPVAYLGLDENPGFVRWLEGRGVRARVHDLLTDPLPPADCVVLQASLYQFHDGAIPLLDRLRKAARRKVVVSEPVSNLARSRFPGAAGLGAAGAATRRGPQRFRYDEEGFRRVVEAAGAARVERAGRDMLAVFDAGSGDAGRAVPGR
jgi:SAM-dependent methyltransferase